MADEEVQYPVEGRLTWWRGPSKVQGEYVVIDPAKAESYVLDTQSGPSDDLAFDYARIAGLDDVVAFVADWGLPTIGPESGSITEPVAEVIADAQRLRTILGMYSDLLGFVEHGGEHQPLAVWQPILRELGLDDSEPVAMAEVAASIVNTGLSSTPLAVAVNPLFGRPKEAPFVASIGATDLRGYIYFHAATLLMGSEPVRTCDECGRPYGVNHPRQRYCSERCGTRARQRRFAERRQSNG